MRGYIKKAHVHTNHKVSLGIELLLVFYLFCLQYPRIFGAIKLYNSELCPVLSIWFLDYANTVHSDY